VGPRSEDPKLAIRVNCVINFELVEPICPRYVNVTDGQTDGQTDGRHTIAIPRLHYVHRAVIIIHFTRRQKARSYSAAASNIMCISSQSLETFIVVSEQNSRFVDGGFNDLSLAASLSLARTTAVTDSEMRKQSARVISFADHLTVIGL